MTATTTFRERRSTPRSGEICLRRRHGQVRATHRQALVSLPLHREAERRKTRSGARFDVATALEINLDRFPTKSGMLTLLQSWLYAAEESGFSSSPDYAQALNRAAEIMKESPDPTQAIVQLWRSESVGMGAA